jgi:hypothetical protein
VPSPLSPWERERVRDDRSAPRTKPRPEALSLWERERVREAGEAADPRPA